MYQYINEFKLCCYTTLHIYAFLHIVDNVGTFKTCVIRQKYWVERDWYEDQYNKLDLIISLWARAMINII